jgi:hypothetical protein
MTRRGRLLIILAMALLALGAILLLSRLEPYEETIDQGPSPEALANPWLAAEHFLRQRSIEVDVAESIHNLPPPEQQSHTLLLLDSRENMTPAQVERLLRWTRSGGHLVFVAEQLWDESRKRSGDLLLDRVQIHQMLTKDLGDQDVPITSAQPRSAQIPLRIAAPSRPEPGWPELTRLYLENEQAPAYMSFDTRFHLEDPQDHAQSWANSAEATHMLQMLYGDGLITVLTDADLWKNRSISKYDNAWLLWYLTQDSKVTLVARTAHDNLFTLLMRHFPHLLMVLALLIGLSLWRAGMRRGPVHPPAETARRQLTEHLRASAEFVRRYSGHQSLVRALQADIQRSARVRHPGFESLVVADQWQVLARLTRQPTSVISQALRPRPAQRMSSADFQRQVAHLQTIRNAL